MGIVLIFILKIMTGINRPSKQSQKHTHIRSKNTSFLFFVGIVCVCLKGRKHNFLFLKKKMSIFPLSTSTSNNVHKVIF